LRTTCHILFVVLLSVAELSGFPACQDAEVVGPAKTFSNVRPAVAWRAIPGTSQYRVEIESRVPEGRSLVSLDTQVSGTAFRPPQPLTDSRAAVKVRVTAGCPADDGSRLREKPATFHIDTSPPCPAPAQIAASDDQREIEWPAVAKAIRYHVTFLDPDDGVVLGQGQTQRTRFALPATGKRLVAVVRPYCTTGFGSRGSALVATPKP
jgi:hypothetical protein